MSKSNLLESGHNMSEYEELTLRNNDKYEIHSDESEVEGRNSGQGNKDIRNNEDIEINSER
jgi:hypothetical protein